MTMQRTPGRFLAAFTGLAALAMLPTGALAQTDGPERIIVPMHFNQFVDGGFWWKTQDILGTSDYVEMILNACNVLVIDCADDAETMAAIAEGITEEATVGITIRGFLAAPEGYQMCRAFSIGQQRVVNGGFLAQIMRNNLDDGLAYAVDIPNGRQLGDRFIDFTAVLEFVADTADLDAYECWPSFEYAWTCDGQACGYYRQRRDFDLTAFTEAEGVTVEGAATEAWGTPVIEGDDGGTIVYEFTVTAPGFYRLEFDYAAAEERPVEILFNDRVINDAGIGRVTQDDWEPRRLVAPLVPPLTFPRWEYEGLVEVRPGINRLELTSDGPFPLILQIRLEPR